MDPIRCMFYKPWWVHLRCSNNTTCTLTLPFGFKIPLVLETAITNSDKNASCNKLIPIGYSYCSSRITRGVTSRGSIDTG